MGSIGNWNWALAIASARFNAIMVKSVFSKWQAHSFDYPPIHEIMYCATNLAFSSELYLKASCVACGNGFPARTHKLGDIFRNTPKEDRAVILNIYDDIFHHKYSKLRFGEIWIKLNDDDAPDGSNGDRRPASLEEVLAHYSSSYEDWRYIFSLGEKNNGSNVRCLHYSRLMALCEAIDLHMQRRFPEIIKEREIRFLVED
jgi:hypothetical protein